MHESDVRAALRTAAPSLVAGVESLTKAWLAPVAERLAAGVVPSYPKILNDTVWGTVELFPYEVLLLDSPLLQRLRGIRQLGMAHLVYPGAGYDRLEHSVGVVESATRILDALRRNAENRSTYSKTGDKPEPPSDEDVAAVRLGALLHDVGHAPFSHATEHLIPLEYPKEFEAAEEVVRKEFAGITSIDPAELMAAMIVLSDAMRQILEHAKFEVRVRRRHELGQAIAARILGSRSYLKATYLSGVVSGPLDADKIDYMARDSHHAGLPLGLDITRLVSKLEIVTLKPDNALNPELKERAELHDDKRFYDVGISRAGLGAYEQLVISRVTLYERLYYHHKVRAAEGMVRNLVDAVAETGTALGLRDLYQDYADDTLVDVWSGRLSGSDLKSGGESARILGSRIRARALYNRAYSFSSRFLTGLEGLPKEEDEETRSVLWSAVTSKLEDFAGCRELALKIHEKAHAIGKALARFAIVADALKPGDIVVDLPKHKRVARGGDILVASETGHIGTPNMFFNADKWGDAYMQQKQSGHVFAPRVALPLIALASRIVFFEQFSLAMGPEADVHAKTHGLVPKEVYDELANFPSVCSAECLETLRDQRRKLIVMQPEHLPVPVEFATNEPGLSARLAAEMRDALPGGLPASVHDAVTKGIAAMLRVVVTLEQDGTFVKANSIDEVKELQPKLRELLRAAGVPVTEATKVAGGATDLVLFGTCVLENKVLKATDTPFDELAPAGWQARRYAIALVQKVRFICAAYPPPTEAGVLALSKRVRIRPGADATEGAAEVLFVVPFGQGIPSAAAKRAPPAAGNGSLPPVSESAKTPTPTSS